MARLDWEKADKRDYVLEHGAIPYWVDMDLPDTGRYQARRPEKPRKQLPTPPGKKAEPSRRSLPEIPVEVSTARRKLDIRWDSGEIDADAFTLAVLRARNGSHQMVRRLRIPEAASSVSVGGLNFAHGPYAVRLFALRHGEAVGRGAVDGIVDSAVPLSKSLPRRHPRAGAGSSPKKKRKSAASQKSKARRRA
jgi:hypothetical protein